MATKKTTASKTAKKAAPPKKAAPVKKSVATKKTVPVKKATAVKPAAKKAATPVKKAAAPAKPVKKAVAAKAPAKKAAVAPKKAAKPVAKAVIPAKKAPVAKPVAKKAVAQDKKAASVKPVKKATPSKNEVKTTTLKKAAPVPTKVSKAPANKAEKKVAAVAKPEIKKAAPVAKPAAVKATGVPVKESKTAKATPAPAAPKRKPQQQHVVTAVPSARSEIVDAVRQLPRKTPSKPGVVIAHRIIEKKAPQEEPGLTMKEYNPSVRSLLDEPEQTSGPVYRYSDEELNEFKELINKRLDNARKELAYLQGLITRKDEAGTDDTDNRFNHMEDGSGAMEREQLSQLAGRQIQFINHLEKAMIRIENKTYGICRVTGKLIDKARLRAVPHATLSIEAKNIMNK